jgi:hypothetical protein
MSAGTAIVSFMARIRLPLSVREGTALQPALRERVPEFVEEELRRWIFQTASLDPDEAKHALIRLGLKLPASYRHRYARELEEARVEQARLDAEWQAQRDAQPKTTESVPSWRPEPRRSFVASPADPHARFLAEGADTTILWDVADDLFHALCTEPLPPGTSRLALGKRADAKRTSQIIEPLRRLLEESRSVHEIRPDQRGLQRRIDAVLAESVNRAGGQAAAVSRPKAREHLVKARDKLFGLHPDPGGAYVEMILAVEELACPLFLPTDLMPTLGKVRNHLRDSDEIYEYILPGKDRTGSTAGVIGMLTDLWEGHSDRHGGGPRCVPVSQETAEVAFTLTVSLITVFSSGAVRRRSP